MIQTLLPWLGDLLIGLGVVIMTIAVYGMLRMPTLYTRLHAATKAVFLGVMPILLASFTTGEPGFIYRAILIGVFLILTTPVSAHAIAWAAYLKHEPAGLQDAVDETERLPLQREPEQRV